MTPQEAGSLGGNKTKTEYGIGFYSMIGRLGGRPKLVPVQVEDGLLNKGENRETLHERGNVSYREQRIIIGSFLEGVNQGPLHA